MAANVGGSMPNVGRLNVVQSSFIRFKIDGEEFGTNPEQNKAMIFRRSVDTLYPTMTFTIRSSDAINKFVSLGKSLVTLEVQYGNETVQSPWWSFIVVDWDFVLRPGAYFLTVQGIPEIIYKKWNSPSTKSYGQGMRPHEIAQMIALSFGGPSKVGYIEGSTEKVRRDFRCYNQTILEFIKNELIPYTCTTDDKPLADFKAFLTTPEYKFNFCPIKLSYKPAHKPVLFIHGNSEESNAFSINSKYSIAMMNEGIASTLKHDAMHLSAFEAVPKMNDDSEYKLEDHQPDEMKASNQGGSLEGAIHMPEGTRSFRLNGAYKLSMKPQLAYYYQSFINNANNTVVEVVGDPRYEIGQVVSLKVLLEKDVDTFMSGRYFIRDVIDVIDGGMYTTHLHLSRPNVNREN